MTTLLFLSGSQRRESFNGRLLDHLAPYATSRCRVDRIEPAEVRLPIFDQDLEADPAILAHLAFLHARFDACDGLVVACPEYNGQPTPYLKNIVDWLSRLPHVDGRFANPFQDRPLLLCSASTGWSGGAAALPHARALFTYVGCQVIDETISIPHAERAWTADGFAFDPFFEMHTQTLLEKLIQRVGECARAVPVTS